MHTPPPFIAAMIIPTGVGASIGGFAGDATPAMNLLASVTDVLITHPNVANAAVFQKLPENALYVEGYGLDQFMLGYWRLRPVRANRIGVVFDAAIDTDMLTLHINTLHAVKSVYGIDLVGYVQTKAPADLVCEVSGSGCSSGSLKNPQVILSACQTLIDAGASAIALCMQLPELPEDEAAYEADYKAGSGVDPIGGIEGILSHLVVSEFKIPCAHAPVFPWEKARPVTDEIIDPRAAAEFIAPTFLPCVLTGLHRAPQFEVLKESNDHFSGDRRNNSRYRSEKADDHVPSNGHYANRPGISVADLSALVVPANALGGLPVLAALQRNIPVIAVEDNQTVLNVDAACFEPLSTRRKKLIRTVRSYEEAAGVLQAMRLGLSGNLSAGTTMVSKLGTVAPAVP